MKTKKAASELGISKIVTILLVVLVVVAVFVFLFRAGLIQKFLDIPGFQQNKTLEKIDITTCPVPVARISGDKVLMCQDDVCEQNLEYDGLLIKGTELKVTDNSKEVWNPSTYIGKINEFKIGTFYGKIKIEDNVLKGIGANYFNAVEFLEPQGVNLERLLTLEGTFLVGKTTLCRFNKIGQVEEERYLRDVRVEEFNGKKFYFGIQDIIFNGYSKSTYVFDDESMVASKISTSYINSNYDFIYVDAEGNEQNMGNVLDNKFYSLDDLKYIKDAKEIGINAYSSRLTAKVKLVNERNYVQFSNERKAISPWVLEDYYLVYGNIGRLDKRYWICLDNCEVK
ncbi:MAG: hypothetical protein WC781_02930 [Candidatus Pacearchaeota archaeon]|jgi:hypothetical protein